jgi:hypothetical protein
MNDNSKTKQEGGDEQKRIPTSDESQQGGSENASSNRGGTTDMDTDALTRVTQEGTMGSGIRTKTGVTGSDYDGQVSPE